jgi:hypothetical protein
MKNMTLRATAFAAALLVLAVLPLAASGAQEQAIAGRQVLPGLEIAAFFEARGADPQYLSKPQAEVPAAQWAQIQAIVATPDYSGTADDHDVLNSLILAQLSNATHTAGDTVYMVLGNSVWSHHPHTTDE